MVASPEEINAIDLDVAERMADLFRLEVAKLPDNSELKRSMTKAIRSWERIVDTLEARCS